MKTVKAKTSFVCQGCGYSSVKWIGKCPDCSSWGSFVEEEVAVRAPRGADITPLEPILLKDVDAGVEGRVSLDIAELDRVLGSGVVKGSVVLIGGDPGIGKSTIALQISHQLAGKGKKVLYVTGEESLRQTKMRSDRICQGPADSFFIVNATEMESIVSAIKKFLPDVVIVDSIQVVYTSTILSSPGSVGQVRTCAHLLTQLAKLSGMTVFLIGHVTKDGNLAGPKVLEHIVDTVLYFEGERFSSYRILRAIKNRFGSTNEVGVFEMTANGLQEVKNPSQIFLAQRPLGVSGSVVVPILEGSRPLLVEIQALVTKANFGVIRRRAQGLDYNRVGLLSAVLEKKAQLKLFDKDVFVNVVGGIKVDDPAVDLGVCLSVASSLNNKPIGSETVVLGEVGLASEVRSVVNIPMRVNEAKKLGFKRCILPRSNYLACQRMSVKGMVLLPVDDLKGAFAALWGK